MTHQGWDDDRLDEAFHARFDRPAPTTLADDIQVRIASTTPGRIGLARPGRARSLTAAAVVTVLVAGTALVAVGGLGRTGGSPLPSAATTDGSGPSPTPTEQALPSVVLGLPLIRVPDAIAIRDAGVDDREIAVAGWFRPAPQIPCPFVPTVNPLQLRCPDGMTWLMRDAESRTFDPPVGPGFNPDLDGLDLSWEPLPAQPSPAGTANPTSVVFVGHFDDRRASLCPADEVDACRDRFVVDQVARADGTTLPRSIVGLTDDPWTQSVAAIDAIIAAEAPQSPILSIQIVQGAALGHSQPSIEPSLAGGQGGLIDRPGLWIVRVLEADRVATYIVDDANRRIYEMDADGQALDVGGRPAASAPAGPFTPAGAWPPLGATVITLSSTVTAGASPVQVAVVDLSGRLLHVAEKGSVDPFDPAVSMVDPGAFTEPGKPGRLHLAWTGSLCDGRITVTVAADIRSMVLENGRRPTCDATGVGRELVLDFSGTVAIPAVVETNENQTTSAGRDYELMCGTLDQSACESRAAMIIGSDPRSPGHRIVSITLSADPCGSYSVLYDDGTGQGTIIDCFVAPSPS